MLKKVMTIIGIVLVIGLLVASTFVEPPKRETLSNDPNEIMKNAERESKAVKDDQKKDFTYISVSEYLDLSQKDENIIFLLGKDNCPYCKTAIPILQELAKKYKLTIYYLNITKFQGDDQDRFLESNEFFKTVGTPFLFITNQEDLLDYINGLTDTAHYKKFFKENGFIE